MEMSGPTCWLIWPAALAGVSSDANQMNLARAASSVFTERLWAARW